MIQLPRKREKPVVGALSLYELNAGYPHLYLCHRLSRKQVHIHTLIENQLWGKTDADEQTTDNPCSCHIDSEQVCCEHHFVSFVDVDAVG